MKTLTKRILGTGRILALLLSAAASIGHAVAAPPEVPRKTSYSTDLSDTWWNAAESGWGMQMTQTGNFIFITVYAYAQDGKPTWFGGGVTATSGANFAGKLYATSGPYFGGSFDPGAVTVREAGTMTFEATGADTANFTYTFDGVTVSKAVSRQPLTLDNYSGAYVAAVTQTVSACTDTATNGVSTGLVIIQFQQDASAMSILITNGTGGSCSASGTYTQLGRDGRFDGTYTCTNGDVGNAVVYEMGNRVRQFSAQMAFQSTNTGCLNIGRLAGLIPD